MTDLRTLLYSGIADINRVVLAEFAVGSEATGPGTGGACCLFTVPPKTQYIRFEMWGGGGSGGSGCCCMQGRAGGAGSYAVKELVGTSEIVEGAQYTICAAPSTSITLGNTSGVAGGTSYITGPNLGTFCARGGAPGCTSCFAWCCCRDCHMCQICSPAGGDIMVCGMLGGNRDSRICFQEGRGLAATAPATVSGPITSHTGCCNSGVCNGTLLSTRPVFPGGGGLSAQVHSGVCYCGIYGSSGLVLVMYG